MKQLLQKHALVLAALLQVLPLARNLVTIPTATSSFAIIMRWAIGSTAALGAYDACSGSSTPYFLPLQTNIVMTVGVYYTNNIVVTNTGTDPGAYFELTNSAGLDSGQLGDKATTTVCLPSGITLKCYDTASTKRAYYAAVYGTPTAVSATSRVSVDAGYSGAGDIYTNVYFTVLGGAVAPTITNQPASVTNVAGLNAAFSVLAGGTGPLAYQWRLFSTNSLAGATNSSLNLTNIHLSQAGGYTVLITNLAGSTTSQVAQLVVTLPSSPVLSVLPLQGNVFWLTFTPAVGLTNTVETNSLFLGGVWNILTNIPPPTSSSSISVPDLINGVSRAYRIRVTP